MHIQLTPINYVKYLLYSPWGCTCTPGYAYGLDHEVEDLDSESQVHGFGFGLVPALTFSRR